MRPLVALSLLIGLAAPAHAGDTWSTVREGVDYLHRTTSEPQQIFAVRVDLTVENVGLHASSDTSGVERRVTTSRFASNADVLVAINGDWSDGTTPVGLAISDGWKWHDHIPDDTLGGRWGFLACTATKACTIGTELPLDTAWWFSNPTLPPYRYFQAVGANGAILLSDGVAASGCYDSANNPRSAVCLDQTGTLLWLVVVDGRSGSASGMTCNETRDLMLDLGCWDAAMLDGGGSSTLVVDGDTVNTPSDGSQRTLANHFGIVYSDTPDPACTVNSGRWCDGTVIGACQGGRFLGSGDCAAYGAGCEEDGDYAYCVDYRCPGGSGSGVACTGATTAASCSDGQYAEGDCGAFGLTCGTDAGGAGCMEARCEAGPNTAFCTDAGMYAACAAGTYTEQSCADGGRVCWEGSGTAACIDARCPAGPDGFTCTDAALHVGCAGGVYQETDCAALGSTCDASAGCVAASDTDSPGDTPGGDDSGAPGDAPSGAGPGGLQPLDGLGCGCHTTGATGLTGALLALIAAFSLGRRRA